MNKFSKALETKLQSLQEERAAHEDAIKSIDGKLEVLNQLCAEDAQVIEGKLSLLNEIFGVVPEEKTEPTPPALKKRKPGRPKGSKAKGTKAGKKSTSTHALDDDLFQEAMRQLATREGGGTSKDFQESRVKSYRPQPRPDRNLGPGITAGTKKQVEQAQQSRKIDANVSIDEGE